MPPLHKRPPSMSRQWKPYQYENRALDERSRTAERREGWAGRRDRYDGSQTRRHDERDTRGRRTASRSPSPDPEVMRFIAENARPVSPDSEAFRRQRIAAAGVSNVKSRHQREREEAERRKREADEDAAEAYKAFVKDMQGTGSEENDVRRRSAAPHSAFVRAGGAAYAPEIRRGAEQSDQVDKLIDHSKSDADDARHSEENEYEHARRAERTQSGKRKMGAMQDFLGELQRDQAQREARLKERVSETTSISSLVARERQLGGPREHRDPNSSNVCVLNLPKNVSEDELALYCSEFGDIASVKIMWPRAEEARFGASPSGKGHAVRMTLHEGATGFVNFMDRKDANLACKKLDGRSWKGSLLRTGWGKTLSKPLRPLFRQQILDRDQDDRTSDNKGREVHIDRARTMRRSSRSPTSRQHRRARHEDRSPSPVTLLSERIVTQRGEEEVKRIRATALRVRQQGQSYERLLREREAENEHFTFLHDLTSIEHQLYMMLVDDDHVPDIVPPSFLDQGYASLYSSDTEEEGERQNLHSQKRTHVFGNVARRRLDAMLRSLTVRRERIALVMLYAIEHASNAESVAERIVDSLILSNTPLPRKLARLYAVSDILHNSSATTNGAWRYRSCFETRLDPVFMHWGDVANSFVGRIKREACKDMARSILDLWDGWLVFDSARLERWRTYVEEGSDASKGLVRSNKSDSNDAANVEVDDDVDGDPMEELQESIDGEAILPTADDALDGEPLV